MIHFQVTVLNTAELLAPEAYDAGALLRWESSDAIDGTYVEGDTIALIADQSLYDVWDPAGVTGMTWYRTRISDAAGTTFSAYSAALLPVPSLAIPSQVRALVPTALTDAQLQEIINREEAALARQITALSGPRTQLFYIGDPAAMGLYWDTVLAATPAGRSAYSTLWIMSDRMGPLGLMRPTDSVAVKDNGIAVSSGDLRLLRQGTLVERATGGWKGPLVEVTYTPNDSLEVVRVVVELCRITMTETGYQRETIGDYTYQKHLRPAPGEIDPRKVLIRSLMTHLPKGTMRIRTSSEDDRIGAVTP